LNFLRGNLVTELRKTPWPQFEPIKAELEQAKAQVMLWLRRNAKACLSRRSFCRSIRLAFLFCWDEDRAVTKAYGLYPPAG